MELPDMSQWMLTEKHAINIHRKINYKTIIKYLLCNYITSKRTYDRWVIRSFFLKYESEKAIVKGVYIDKMREINV